MFAAGKSDTRMEVIIMTTAGSSSSGLELGTSLHVDKRQKSVDPSAPGSSTFGLGWFHNLNFGSIRFIL